MKLTPFSKKAYVGLDLGHYTLKAVVIERHHGNYQISRALAVPTPEGAIRDGVVSDVEAVAMAIRQLLREARIHATNAVIGVAGGSVIVRSVRIPKMDRATLRKSIQFEAGRYVPSSIEDSYIEFEIVGDIDEAQMEVMVVAAPRDIVQSRLAACEKAGLEVDIVDIEAFALYRSLVEAADMPIYADETIALLDIGSATTHVSVIDHGKFTMTRTIPQAGQTLTEALVNFFKLAHEDAEQGKAMLNLTELLDESVPHENPPLRVLQPHIDDLIREIRRSLNYYQSQQTESGQNNPVTRLVVSGGGANLPGLGQYLEQRLGLAVDTIGVLDNPRFTSGSSAELGHGMELAVASGLALRAFEAA